MIIFSFQSMLDACSVSVWNAEDSSETRLLVTCWLQESEKISVSQYFGSMTYHIPLVILYIHRLFLLLSACSHPWWWKIPHLRARDQKESFEGWRSPLGVWERNRIFFFLWIMVYVLSILRCLMESTPFQKGWIFSIYLRYLWLERWLERSSYLLSRPFGCLLSADCPIHHRLRWPWFIKNWPKLHLWRRSRLKPGDETMRSDEDERPSSAIFKICILFGWLICDV